MILPLAIDVVLVAALWWFLADQADVPMALVQRSVPDVFLAAVVASVIGLGWQPNDLETPKAREHRPGQSHREVMN